MSDCPANYYLSTFLDSCIRCPNQLKICDNESPTDSQSCRKSCSDRSPLSNEDLSIVSKDSSPAVVIGTVVGLLALLVLLVMLLYYRYVKLRKNAVPRDTESSPHEDEPETVDSQNLLNSQASNVEEPDERADEGLEMESSEIQLHNPDEIPGSVDKSRESLDTLGDP